MFQQHSKSSSWESLIVLHMADSGKEDTVYVECCRRCSFRYEFLLQSGQLVTVLCGRPKNVEYSAISYLWEDTIRIPLHCQKCSEVITVPMRDSIKLSRILEFVRGGATIWLDALSINQDDPKDLNAQLAMMGDIYLQAERVSVLLPSTDYGAYEMLKQLGTVSDEIVKKHKSFGMLQDPPQTPVEQVSSEKLEELATRYMDLVHLWVASLHQWAYWRRAWTFQEWAMASEIDISLEGSKSNESLKSIKNVIVMASAIIAYWKMEKVKKDYPLPEGLKKLIKAREELGKDRNLVRAHFPFQDFLISDDEQNPTSQRASAILPAFPSSMDSGTYVTPSSKLNPSIGLRSGLSLALNAMKTSKREARYEADRVACWASMCNIEYDYSKDDTFAVALHKVVTVLRKRGFRIYNFHVNTSSAETDLLFLEYAASHRSHHSSTGAFLYGSPIFTGRADTVTHISLCLQDGPAIVGLKSNSIITLKKIKGGSIESHTLFDNIPTVIGILRSIVSGKAVENSEDVISLIQVLLTKTSSQQLQKCRLVTAQIPVKDSPVIESFLAWTICPSDIEPSGLFVAQESLNGTLILAVQNPSSMAKETRILSYFTMTHQRDGTFLIVSDETGLVDVVFRPLRPQNTLSWMQELNLPGLDLFPNGLDMLDTLDDRALGVQITLEKDSLSLSNAWGSNQHRYLI